MTLDTAPLSTGQANRPGVTAILMFAVLALLPMQRYADLPVLVMSLWGLAIWLRRPEMLWRDARYRLLAGLWLCYALPMVIASLDAVNPAKSWVTTAASLRFLLLGIFVVHTLGESGQRRWLWRLGAWLVLFWSVDALVQAVLGYNLLGIPHSDDRLNGIFGENIKLGPVLAAVSPLLLEYARRFWKRWALVVCYGLLLSVIVVTGTRAAWVMYAVVSLCYVYLYARHHPRRWIKSLLLIAVLTGSVGVTAYQFSPTLQERVDRSMLLLHGDADAVNQALSRRLPIWSTALNMSAQHPINGVGPRGFRYAYADFSAPDDPWRQGSSGTGASHAHQLFLEVLTETGIIGLVGLLAGAVVMLRHWRSLDWQSRTGSLPAVIGLGAMVFPVNTHLAFYSTFWSLLFWWLLAVYCAFATPTTDERAIVEG